MEKVEIIETELFHLVKIDNDTYLLISKKTPTETLQPSRIRQIAFDGQDLKQLPLASTYTPYFTEL